MFNEITIGPLTLHMYGLMIGLGFLAAYAMCYYRGKKMKMEKSGDILYGIFWCAIIGGLVGTRLLYYIVEIPEIIKDPSILWDFKNGYVVYGGIIGGILVSWLYCRIKKVSFIEYFDLVMPAVALAQGFGRIGCFFCRLLLRKSNGQLVWNYFYSFRLCSKWSQADTNTAYFICRRLHDLPDAACLCKA